MRLILCATLRMHFKLGFTSLLRHVFLLNILLQAKVIWTLNCDKSFTYYEEYGQNSFNVSCNGITKGYEHILENITINNEISLTISDSVLEGVTPDIFKNVKNIKILHMFNCTFEYDRQTAIFSRLKKLETLTVQDTTFVLDNVTFDGLVGLKHLSLDNNSIDTIPKRAFAELRNLEKLEIVDNHVRELEALPLCELKKLKTLNLRNNLLSSLKYFYFYCFKNSKSLDVNINSRQAVPSMYETLFYNVTNAVYDLVNLDLSYNQIVELGHSLDDISKLRTLNLGYNKLTNIKSITFKTLTKLQKLMLNNNDLRMFDSRMFVNKSQLTYIDLSNNFLSTFIASDIPQLQYLDLRHNNISTISLKKLNNLKKINLGFNSLQTMDADALQDIPKIVSLNLAGNNLILNEGIFQSIHPLKYLVLSYNSLVTLPQKVFLGLKNLRILDLSYNMLQNLDSNTFHDLESLEVLNLSANHINSLSYQVVEPLVSLRSLDISANKLVYIEYDVILSKLPFLNNINIKSNLLSCENLAKIVIFLKKKHIVYTNSEQLDVGNLNQNVAGIACKSETVSANRLMVDSKPTGNGALFTFGILFLVVLISILTGIVAYRFYIYLKRRRYRADEFELVVD